MERKTREEHELEMRKEKENYPSYNHPLEFRPLKITDTLMLAPVMKRSANYIKGYVHWGTSAKNWGFKDVQNFVSARVRDDFPRFHFVFLIGKEPVALGSLAPMDSPFDAQVSLAVFHPHQGKKIGEVVVKTLEWYAFVVWGFHNLYYQYDATNKNSQKLANRCGFPFSHSFEQEKTAELESGLWMSHKKSRDPNYPDAIFQGADIEYWGIPRDASLLDQIVKYQQESNAEIEDSQSKGFTD